MNNEKKNGIDWLRMIACIGIVLMHIRYNISYAIPGDLFIWMVNSFDDFVYLFMAISSFGLCCGYYHAFLDGSINWDNFYRRRFSKILPFFITMIMLDLCMSFSVDSLMQALVESTLFHGFIPMEFTVIGVGWFLGIIFIFYMSFPFFCVLLKNKKIGWIAFLIALGLNLICQYYFDISRRNFAFSFCYFLIGGLIFLYKDKIEQTKWWHLIIIIILSVVLYYINANTITRALLTASILAFGVSLNIRPFKPVSFISSISMEIYLCHMVIYRALERINCFKVLGGGIKQYLMTCIVVFIGACAMSVFVKFVLEKLFEFIKKWDLILVVFAVIILLCGCWCGYRVTKNEKNQNLQMLEMNASISQSSEENVLSGENIERQNNEYNYLAIGNSITLHGIENIWWNEIGMAASDEDHDYFHLVLKYLEENNDYVKGIPYNFVEWETETRDRDKMLGSLDTYLSPELDLVTIQLGENVRDFTTYPEDYVSLINYVKEKAPKARILVIEDFWSDEYTTELEKNITEKTGVEFVSLEGITNNKEYFCGLYTIVYDKDGGKHIVEEEAVANHPGDKGMAAIASNIIEKLKNK